MLNGWLWIVAALLLALAELLLPGYLFLGTAVGVGLMGLALLAGLWAGPFAWALVVTALAGLTGFHVAIARPEPERAVRRIDIAARD